MDTSVKLQPGQINDLLTWRLLHTKCDEMLPEEHRHVASLLVKDEDVPVIDPEYIRHIIPTENYDIMADPTVVPFRRMSRRICEFSTQYVQLVGAVLLHTDDNIVMLRLKRDNVHVDGYKINTVTVPEGHVSWNAPMFPADSDIVHMDPKYVINTVVRNCAFREFCEEITLRTDVGGYPYPVAGYPGSYPVDLMHNFREYVQGLMDCNFNPHLVRTVFVPEAGSSIKHLLFCYDIHVTHGLYKRLIDEYHFLDSGEPSKHEVIYVDKKNLPRHIVYYDLYVKELFAQCAEDWLLDFMYSGN